MALKDKDGKVYRLRGPNPLLKEQREWDKSKITVFNMIGKLQLIDDEEIVNRQPHTMPYDIGEVLKEEVVQPEESKTVSSNDFLEEIEETTKDLKDAVEEIPETVVIHTDPKLARIISERGASYYCSPAVGTKSHKDELYGDTWTTTIFGEKFIFDAIVIDQSELQIQFWCLKPLSKNSIVLKKDSEGGEIWWQIDHVEAKTGGYLCLGHVSDLNPDFS